ncbi:solute carrier family 17 member 9-like [Sparus aurata]|uniref:Voltage-gated purine nucleotide uniporter SLC17A9 n=1 Tax=Sparus aurata TaxID=8175 RepID=A0A671VLY1_SPAAU|nr:solute carrier family 17 member 9-like [Sparus aurata]
MADKHTSGDGRNDYIGSILDPKICSANACSEEEAEDPHLWPRPLARKWIPTLFMGTCLLLCARMVMPVCAVSMSASLNWSKIDTGLVLGGFFWGYCLTQILGGHASDKMGGERVLFMSAASWSLITAATPLLGHMGSHTAALMTLARFLMGLLQGVFYPSLASLCSQRVVEGERGLLMSTMNAGGNLGMLLAGALASLLLDRYGWESVFYASGFLSGLWAVIVWRCFLKGEVAPKPMQLSRDSQHVSLMRCLRLLKVPSVWAMVFAHMCISSTSYTLLSWLPTYFEESFPHAKGWVYNIVPWFTAIPSGIGGGCLSDHLINQGYRVSHVRKLMQFLAMGASSVFILLLSGAVTFPSSLLFVCAAIGLCTFTSGGVTVNVQDLTPSCAGALFGFMNMCGAFMGLMVVSASGYLIEVTQSWVSVFSLIVLINVTGLGVFLIFGDARRVDLDGYRKMDVS